MMCRINPFLPITLMETFSRGLYPKQPLSYTTYTLVGHKAHFAEQVLLTARICQQTQIIHRYMSFEYDKNATKYRRR